MSTSNTPVSLLDLEQPNDFIRRHIGPGRDEMASMLDFIGADSLEDLMQQTVPAGIRYLNL
jgi:glycine dehydrogenase